MPEGSGEMAQVPAGVGSPGWRAEACEDARLFYLQEVQVDPELRVLRLSDTSLVSVSVY